MNRPRDLMETILATSGGSVVSLGEHRSLELGSERFLAFSILTTGAELCDRLDQMIELEKERISLLRESVKQGDEQLRLHYNDSALILQGNWQRSSDAEPSLKSTTEDAGEGEATEIVEPSGGDSTREPPEQRT